MISHDSPTMSHKDVTQLLHLSRIQQRDRYKSRDKVHTYGSGLINAHGFKTAKE